LEILAVELQMFDVLPDLAVHYQAILMALVFANLLLNLLLGISVIFAEELRMFNVQLVFPAFCRAILMVPEYANSQLLNPQAKEIFAEIISNVMLVLPV